MEAVLEAIDSRADTLVDELNRLIRARAELTGDAVVTIGLGHAAPDDAARALPPAPESPAAPLPPTRRSRVDLDAEVMAYVSANTRKGVASPAVASAVGLSLKPVRASLQRLVEAGKVMVVGQTRNTRYHVATSGTLQISERAANQSQQMDNKVRLIGIRNRAMEAISRNPGKFSDEHLANELGVDREDLAVVTGALIEGDHICLDQNALWVPVRG